MCASSYSENYRCKCEHTQEIDMKLESNVSQAHSLTIAVCTYNRAGMLHSCLSSLVQQKVPLESFNVLVVDNNSSDETMSTAEEFFTIFPSYRVILERQQGSSHARNRAVNECNTPWIAFLDDDAKAKSDWVKNILHVIDHNDFDAFGGPYAAWLPYGPLPAWLPSHFVGYQPKHPYGPLQQGAHIPGGNCAIRMEALKKIGGFSGRMGMKGKICGYGEETLLFLEMQLQGFRLGFVPRMEIEHCVLPYKYSLTWQLRSAFSSDRDWIRLQKLLGIKKRSLLFSSIISTIKNLHNVHGYTWKQTIFIYFVTVMRGIGSIFGVVK